MSTYVPQDFMRALARTSMSGLLTRSEADIIAAFVPGYLTQLADVVDVSPARLDSMIAEGSVTDTQAFTALSTGSQA